MLNQVHDFYIMRNEFELNFVGLVVCLFVCFINLSDLSL